MLKHFDVGIYIFTRFLINAIPIFHKKYPQNLENLQKLTTFASN